MRIRDGLSTRLKLAAGAMMFGLLFNSALFAQFDLSAPTQISATPGDSLLIPLNLTNDDGNSINAYGLTLFYPTGLLTFDMTSITGTLTEDWITSSGQENTPGQITIGGFNTTPITTSGVLINVGFTVNEDAAGADTLKLRSFVNDLADATTTDGIISIQEPEVFIAIMNGDQEVPPIVTPATGELTASLSGDELVVTGAFSGLAGEFDMNIAGGSHFHLAPAGRSGDIEITLVPTLDADMRGGTFEEADNTFTLTPAQIAALEARKLYGNIHTTTYPGGELRGQLVPQAEAQYRVNLSGVHEMPAITSTGNGVLVGELNGNELTLTGSFNELTGDFDANVAGGSHLHLGIAGQNGGIEITLEPTLDVDMRGGTFEASDNTFVLDTAQLDALQGKMLYANIHTLTFPAGELRGQLLAQDASSFDANLAGGSEVPPVDSPAGGALALELNGRELTVTGSFFDLTGDFDANISGGSHLHWGFAGQNGGIEITLVPTLDADQRNGVFEVSNNTFTLSDSQATALRQRMLYANIHTTTYPSGELRGQIIPNSYSSHVAYLAGNNEVPPVESSGQGGVVAELAGDRLIVTGAFSNLVGDFDANISGGSHLHLAPAGENGSIFVTLVPELDGDLRGGTFEASQNSFSIAEDQSNALRADSLYANIHTTEYAPGELRGQLLRNPDAFPGLSLVLDPANFQTVRVGGMPSTSFTVTWSSAADRDENLVVYGYMLAANPQFQNPILNVSSGTDTSLSMTFGTLDSLLSEAGVSIGDSITLHQAAISSDGSLFRMSPEDSLNYVRDGFLISIADARMLENGEEATVEGIVTRALGRLTRIQDETAGITIFQTSGDFRDAVDNGEVRMGDRLRVSGEVTEFSALKQISPVSTFEVMSRDNDLPDAQLVTLADLAADGEDYESELIRVELLTIDSGGDTAFVNGQTYEIADPSDPSGTITLRTGGSDDTDIEGAPIPIAEFVFEGVLGQFSSTDSSAGYQLQPVLSTDVIGGLAIPIIEARVMGNGENAIVEGIVTRALGRLTRIQDETAGITIFQTSGDFRDAVDNGDVRMGDHLRVSGALTEFNSLKEISPIFSFEVLSRNNELPEAQLVALADLAANGEDYESELIRVENLEITFIGDDTFKVGTTYQVSDSTDDSNAVTLRTASAGDTDISGRIIPSTFNFQGVLGQFSASDSLEGYQLQIVLRTDIEDLEVGVEYDAAVLPDRFELLGNYPNPFNPTTMLSFDLPAPAVVKVDIFDLQGRRVMALPAQRMDAGAGRQIAIEAGDLTSGVYFYRLHVEIGQQVMQERGRIMLMK